MLGGDKISEEDWSGERRLESDRCGHWYFGKDLSEKVLFEHRLEREKENQEIFGGTAILAENRNRNTFNLKVNQVIEVCIFYKVRRWVWVEGSKQRYAWWELRSETWSGGICWTASQILVKIRAAK